MIIDSLYFSAVNKKKVSKERPKFQEFVPNKVEKTELALKKKNAERNNHFIANN